MLKNTSKEDFSPFEKLVINIIVKNKYIFLSKFQEVWRRITKFWIITCFRMNSQNFQDDTLAEPIIKFFFSERGDIFQIYIFLEASLITLKETTAKGFTHPLTSSYLEKKPDYKTSNPVLAMPWKFSPWIILRSTP